MPDKLSSVSARGTLSEAIDHRLKLYATAAAAAGVSMLALSQPAEAEVVVTKTNVPINFGSQVSIDLNNDGVNDFLLSNGGGGYDHSFWGTFVAAPLAGGKVVGGTRGILGPYASALMKGANIGPSAHFSSSGALGQITVERSVGFASASTFRTYYGKWAAVDRYLGVKFLIKGVPHYGWIRMTVTTPGRFTGMITEYAYETVPNKKIAAGDGSDSSIDTASVSARESMASVRGPSIGMLALGAEGLELWRRKQNPAETGVKDLKE
jgi:hypothetical protein